MADTLPVTRGPMPFNLLTSVHVWLLFLTVLAAGLSLFWAANRFDVFVGSARAVAVLLGIAWVCSWSRARARDAHARRAGILAPWAAPQGVLLGRPLWGCRPMALLDRSP